MTEKYYKVLNANGTCFHGGKSSWPLPEGKLPGKWMPEIKGELSPCAKGYHVLKPEMLVQWLGPAIFEVEIAGDVIWQPDKGVCSQARLVRRMENWNDQTARLFACDCADAVRHLMKDKRSTDAVDVARRFAFGLATKEELAAAWDAAWAAERDVAWDAAWDAARDAAWAAAKAAAWDAARDAAMAAAWDAARDAAWAAAKAAQTKRLFQYLNGEVDLEAMKEGLK